MHMSMYISTISFTCIGVHARFGIVALDDHESNDLFHAIKPHLARIIDHVVDMTQVYISQR